MVENSFHLQNLLSYFTPVLVAAIIVLWGWLYARWRRTHLRPSVKNAPILMTHAFTGSKEVINAKSWVTPGGLYVQYLVGMQPVTAGSQSQGVHCIELPFVSGIHLVGIPKTGEDMKLLLGRSAMEPVVLEGDYPNYFLLYADRGSQQHARFVLDPKAMIFTVDFCKNYTWEVIDDSLYFMSSHDAISVERIDQFVAEIRPALELKSARQERPELRMPYAQAQGRLLNCPICEAVLGKNADWLTCPNGHGSLVSAKQLLALRSNSDTEEEDSKVAQMADTSGAVAVEHAELRCPYCRSSMESRQFVGTTTTIDICTKCPFRWLDADEAKKLWVR